MYRRSLSILLILMLSMIGIVLVAGPAVAATRRSTQARAWERADANGDGVLTREEVRRIPRIARYFDAIDSDRDGVITGGEVRAWRESRKLRGRTLPPRGVDEIMKMADINGDGELSRAEFAKGLPRFASRFDRIDANGDGRLAKKELADWLASRRPMRPSQKTGN
jgi:Ca2+-binding EF-hand superfamily protein